MKQPSQYNFILYLLILLTAFQSVDAIADAVKFHQPNSQYSEADYFINNSTVNDSQEITTSSNTETSNDVDHCCYCHGVSSLVQVSYNLSFQILKHSEDIISNRVNYLSQLISPEHRPPIV